MGDHNIKDETLIKNVNDSMVVMFLNSSAWIINQGTCKKETTISVYT
jgi:hypothetical protein